MKQIRKLASLLALCAIIAFVPMTARASTYSPASSVSATLLLSIVDTVDFPSTCTSSYTVFNRSSGDIYVTTDGTTPTVGGDGVYYVPSNQNRVFPPLAAHKLKLVSPITATYTAECT